MEIVPCSHVGHIFRSAMPYTFGDGGTYHNTVGRLVCCLNHLFVHFINVAIAGLSFLTAIADVATRLQLSHKEDLVAVGTCMVCTFTLASQLAGCLFVSVVPVFSSNCFVYSHSPA